MKSSFTHHCALVALLVVASATRAHAASSPDAGAPVDLGAGAFDVVAAPVATLPVAPAATLELAQVPMPAEQVLGVHYRQRDSHSRRVLDSQSVSQIHLGFFDPDGTPGAEFLMGIRGGPMLDPHVQLGIGLDWSHITDNASAVKKSTPGPNGTTLTVEQSLSRSSTNLFPIMAFVQFSGDDDMALIPYGGLAGGYEVMHLSADNFDTNTSFDATYGGWGWQAWAGVAYPLSGQVRVSGELFYNTAEPGRDVAGTDVNAGLTIRETVKANGGGLRVGMAWGF